MGAFKTVTTISADEGVLAFWKGIPAAWLREASYTAIRLGLYKPIVDSTGATGFLGKFSAGCIAGGIGSVVGNPFDVLKTKMMATEGTAEPIIKVAERIKVSQGLGGFYRGTNQCFKRLSRFHPISFNQMLRSPSNHLRNNHTFVSL